MSSFVHHQLIQVLTADFTVSQLFQQYMYTNIRNLDVKMTYWNQELNTKFNNIKNIQRHQTSSADFALWNCSKSYNKISKDLQLTLCSWQKLCCFHKLCQIHHPICSVQGSVQHVIKPASFVMSPWHWLTQLNSYTDLQQTESDRMTTTYLHIYLVSLRTWTSSFHSNNVVTYYSSKLFRPFELAWNLIIVR